jgi:hypothetical protein
MPTQIRKIDKPIDRAQHVIGRHELVEANFVKKTLLHHEPIAHHHPNPLPPQLKRITGKRWSRALFQQNPPAADILDRMPNLLDANRLPTAEQAQYSRTTPHRVPGFIEIVMPHDKRRRVAQAFGLLQYKNVTTH